MNVKINNVTFKELYSGAKIVDDKYEKTNVAGSIYRELTVLGSSMRIILDAGSRISLIHPSVHYSKLTETEVGPISVIGNRLAMQGSRKLALVY
jgi:hypothetical protein